MESFVSGLRGELEIRGVVLWNQKPFQAECKEIDDGWAENDDTHEVEEVRKPAGRDVLSVIHRQKIHLSDNTTLGKRLKHHGVWNSGCYILLVPPNTEINDEDLVPVLKNLHDHIAVMRGGSAVILRPSAHFDLKIDDKCYIIIPPNLVDKYAENAPEPLHLVVYVLAIVVTVAVLFGIFYRTRRFREDGQRINFETF